MTITQRIIPESANHPLLRPTSPPTLVLHTNGAKNSVSSLYNYIISSGVHVYPHFQVAWDGSIEQYCPLDRQAFAQYDGNLYAYSAETQDSGYGSGIPTDNDPWSDAQLRALAGLAARLGCPARACTSPTSGGIGYHQQFKAEWNRDGHNCPGTARRTQIPQIIAYMTPPPTDEDSMPAKTVRKTSTGEIALFAGGKLTHAPKMNLSLFNRYVALGLIDGAFIEMTDAEFDSLPT